MGTRILLAEDENGLRIAFTILLEDEGYEINAVKDGLEAWAAIQTNTYDLVLSDIRMPGMTGLQLLEEVKKMPGHPEMVLLTAYGTIENAQQALKHGAREILIKPFSNDDLKRTIRHILQRPKRSSVKSTNGKGPLKP
jgi:DNA-binding NtrC family response regulator